ncbi:hypothetical protein M758_1G101700 [Ceratodon purpureus]|nr:hypothetical protein M758_1G101700 [Ceratodon purpureus]
MMQRALALPGLWRSYLPSLPRRVPLCTLPLPQAQEEQTSGRQHLVVTASGADRPGIVARLSKRVLDCGGNLEISRMARLAGEFSVLMLVTFDITTRWTSHDRMQLVRPLNKFRKILLRGVDNPGLVYNLTEYLASYGINIESLETYTQETASGGVTLFMMEGVIAMPVGLSTASFIKNLDTLQATLGAEIKISDLPNPAHHKFAAPNFQDST